MINFEKTQYWLDKKGRPHRDDDLPAVIHANGEKIWCQHGLVHRDDDRPAVISADRLEWYKDGYRHREEDCPAVVDAQTEWWYLGVLHRERNRPAIIRENGQQERWILGVRQFDQ